MSVEYVGGGAVSGRRAVVSVMSSLAGVHHCVGLRLLLSSTHRSQSGHRLHGQRPRGRCRRSRQLIAAARGRQSVYCSGLTDNISPVIQLFRTVTVRVPLMHDR